jgi:hypothetical protein
VVKAQLSFLANWRFSQVPLGQLSVRQFYEIKFNFIKFSFFIPTENNKNKLWDRVHNTSIVPSSSELKNMLN